MAALTFIMERIREKPDASNRVQNSGDAIADREKQVLLYSILYYIVILNSTTIIINNKPINVPSVHILLYVKIILRRTQNGFLKV